MKTIVFFKAIDKKIENYNQKHILEVTYYTDYYDKSNPEYGLHNRISGSQPPTYYDEKLFVIRSSVHTKQEIIDLYSNLPGAEFLTASDALKTGQYLQPDRQIENPTNPEEMIDYTFSLGITKNELKKQAKYDIEEKEEAKAKGIWLKHKKKNQDLTQEESDMIDTFLNDRDAVLDQYEIDKFNLGLSE